MGLDVGSYVLCFILAGYISSLLYVSSATTAMVERLPVRTRSRSRRHATVYRRRLAGGVASLLEVRFYP